MKTSAYRIAAIAVAALLASNCGDASSEYSDYPCRFVFSIPHHAHSAALQSAVSTTGVFCKVTKILKGGAEYFRFTTNHGLSDDVIFTAEDKRATVALGMNKALWFGYGNLDNPPVFYGYDSECPNCFVPDRIPVRSHPLDVSTAGLASCPTCKRKYNMNTGGNIVEGDKGKPLTRYRAVYSPDGVVAVVR